MKAPIKPKLPRKRKKKAIKAQGRKWYHDTIKLHHLTWKANLPDLESVCKFWINDKLETKITTSPNNQPVLIKGAVSYW